MKKPETKFRHNEVDPFLRDLELVYKAYFMSISQASIVGDPDKIGGLHGRLVALELKSDGERPTPIQEWKLQRISEAGGVALWTCPSRWESTKRELLKLAEGGT